MAAASSHDQGNRFQRIFGTRLWFPVHLLQLMAQESDDAVTHGLSIKVLRCKISGTWSYDTVLGRCTVSVYNNNNLRYFNLTTWMSTTVLSANHIHCFAAMKIVVMLHVQEIKEQNNIHRAITVLYSLYRHLHLPSDSCSHDQVWPSNLIFTKAFMSSVETPDVITRVNILPFSL